MKKRMVGLLLVLLLTLALACPYAGAIDADRACEECSTLLIPCTQFASQDEAAAYYLTKTDHDAFGGVYYDTDGVLVVNVVGEQPNMTTYSCDEQSAALRYQEVPYSIGDLEEVKDFLTLHMDEYSIAVLDANEMVNQVEVGLEVYTEETMEQVTTLVKSEFPGMDCLHFEDYSDCSVLATVGREPSGKSPLIDLAALPPASNTTLVPGWEIKIGNGYYTLGPCDSSSIAYSAGHGFSGSVSVIAGIIPVTNPLGYEVGRAVSYFGGSYKDWSRITAGRNITFGYTTVLMSPVAGKPIKMIGTKSGSQTGSITGTNVSVKVNGTTLTGMCSGDYLCALGDSGAGIFDNTKTPVVYHYGVQSSAVFNSSGKWAGVSYFTPLA